MRTPAGSRPVLTTLNCLGIIPVDNVKSGTPRPRPPRR